MMALQQDTAPTLSARRIDREALRRHVRELPALPQAAMRALSTLRREDASAAECAEDIEHDQALAARTLQLANSAFYGVPGRVATVRDAVYLLGRRTLGALLTTATVTAQFSQCPAFDVAAFWRHALGTAIAAQVLAGNALLDDDLAFTAGLLHDIGRLALAAAFPDELAAALALARAGDNPLVDAEHCALGITHAEVGAMIAGHWRFPAAVIDAIADHHAPPPAARATLADLVHAADAVAHALDLNADPDEMVPDIDAAAWQRLDLPPAAWLHAFERTETAVAALSQALGVSA